jgi:uncharacterized protein (TIGR01619 family)
MTMRTILIIATTITGLTISMLFMGLFDKLFSKQKEQPSTIQTPKKYSQDWDFYLTNVDNKLGSIAVDLGLHSIAPVKDQTNVVWVSIKMNNPRQDGLSSDEEFKLLGEIEDNLVVAINSKHNSTFVGRLTSNGHRDLYFYLGDTLLYDKTISDIMVSYPKYKYDFGSKEDKNWDGYFNFLYPAPNQFQSIQNRRVIDNLVKNGDKLTKAREVDHWIYFKTELDRKSFLIKIKNDGFTIVDNDLDKPIGEFPFSLHIKRIDKVDQTSVDEYVIYLWKLANECNGDYDGWETSVEKD